MDPGMAHLGRRIYCQAAGSIMDPGTHLGKRTRCLDRLPNLSWIYRQAAGSITDPGTHLGKRTRCLDRPGGRLKSCPCSIGGTQWSRCRESPRGDGEEGGGSDHGGGH